MIRILVATFTATMLLAVPALAEDKKAAPAGAPPAPAPSKELAAFMKGMDTGTWKCDTKMMAGAMGPGSPEMTGASTIKFTKDMGGMLFKGEWATAKSKTNPMDMKGVMLIAYDETNKVASIVSYDSMGGMAMETGTMTADTMTTTGDAMMMGKVMKMKETITHNPDKSVTHKMEVDTGKGFEMMGEDICKSK